MENLDWLAATDQQKGLPTAARGELNEFRGYTPYHYWW